MVLSRHVTDCVVHFLFDKVFGMKRHPMINHNMNHVNQNFLVLDLGLFENMIHEASEGRGQYEKFKASFKAAEVAMKKLAEGADLFVSDKLEWFPRLKAGPSAHDNVFEPTKRIQGVPIHKAPPKVKESPGCQDLYKKNTPGSTWAQAFNYLLKLDSPMKLL